ncbi:MAG: HD domain-containing protein [Thermoplasmatales archaeon]|nr:HD domain-containing protein [Thermoplasmatales archaeon]
MGYGKYEIRDPIYGFITFNDWEKEIINHPCFQRLRRIRQLSLTDLVYPGAMHTRFEHSLGVMHLATTMFDSIVTNPDNLGILKRELDYDEAGVKRDRQIIRFAGLLHDIGHAPFSHSSETIMPRNSQTGKPYKHEDYGAAIIKGPLRDVLENHSINNNYHIRAEEIAAFIERNPQTSGERIFWKVFISSQLDADRGDYLLRDSYHIGVKYGIYDHSRLMNTLALGVDPESQMPVLGIDRGGWHIAESIVLARYQLFTQVYFHKTRRAYDYHLKEAAKVAIPGGQLPAPNNVEEFLKFDDITLCSLFKNRNDDINCNSITSRDHIRVYRETPETPKLEDEKEIERVKQALTDENIWYYEDRAEGLWYKLKGSEEGTTEIRIIQDDGKIQPLEDLSSVVRNIGEIKKIRIYVKPREKEKAEEAFNKWEIASLRNLP